jgi:DNA-binding winged helix-turn-helix (wHTH) protein
MVHGSFRFAEYRLDPADRRLMRGTEPVELNGRYLDALALMVREQGRLVSKDRFMDEVWSGIPVTDEALTQCIKTLRRQLGDDAANPRFIETVPKHGYRFIAPVETSEGFKPPSLPRLREFLLLGGAGTIGGGIAGVIGGLFYGFAGASQPLAPGLGAASVLLVLLSVTILVALTGGAGVAFGIAAAGRPSPWSIVGGAAGGLVVGAVVKLLGLDAFNLLLGRSPGDITGAPEGLIIGAATGLGVWLGSRGRRPFGLRRNLAIAALTGGCAGLTIILLGGTLMGGSLDLLASQFPGSRLRLDQIGAIFGESGFGPISRLVTGCLEAMLFSACAVTAMAIARRDLNAG